LNKEVGKFLEKNKAKLGPKGVDSKRGGVQYLIFNLLIIRDEMHAILLPCFNLD